MKIFLDVQGIICFFKNCKTIFKKVIICLTLLFIITSTYSIQAQQIRFNKIYELDGSAAIYNTVHNIIPIENNEYYFSGNSRDLVNIYNSHFFYGIMNDTGKIIQLKKVHLDSVSIFYNEYSCRDRQNYFTTFFAYSNLKNAYDVYLCYINKNLDTLWTKKIGIDKYNIQPFKIKLNKRNNAIIVGGFNSCWMGCPAKDFFLEIDTFGNIVQFDTSITSIIYDIIESKTDNGYIAAGINYIGSEGQNFICKLDSSGHLIWSRSLGVLTDYSGSLSLEFVDDTTFVVAGFRRLGVGGDAFANLIVINESNQLKRDYLPSVPEVSLRFIQNIIKRGNYYYGYGKSPSDSVVIFCMDTAFNFIWARYYLRDRSPNVLYDFRETPDGGFVACGFVIGPLNQDGWVLKLDSLGCDVSNCWIKDTTADTATIIIPAYSLLQNIKIYPNPIRNKFQVEFEAMDIGENYSIDIKNMLGEIIFTRTLDETKSEIDIHSIDAALYLYEIKNKDGMRVACGKLLKE